MKLCKCPMHDYNLWVFLSLTEIRSPDPAMLVPEEFVAPRNGFAMPYRDFLSHLMNVLDQLGMSVHAKTNFIQYVHSHVIYEKTINCCRVSVITFHLLRRTRTLHIDSYLHVGLLPLSILVSPRTLAFLLEFSSSSAELPMTSSGTLQVQARRRQTPIIGAKPLAGASFRRILNRSGCLRPVF